MENVEGFILAGGASSRMGVNKAALKLNGKTFVEVIFQELQNTGIGKVSIVGGSADEETGRIARSIPVSILPDLGTAHVTGKGGRASILGLYTALKNSGSELAFVIACDLPLITSGFMKSLYALTSDRGLDAVVPIQENGRPQPFCAFYRRSKTLAVIEDALVKGELKMTGILNKINFRGVPISKNEAWDLFNVNTPDEFRTAETIFNARLP